MNTPACIESTGKTIIAKDVQSQRVIDRINKVDALFCDMRHRIRIEATELARYCPLELTPPSESESASISDCCPVGHCYPPPPEFQYLINVTDLDEEIYDILEMLESEVCATNDILKDFEAINESCNPSGTSDSISKSISDSNSASLSASISKSVSDSISISLSNSESISRSDSDSISKSVSDSISKSVSDSISKSVSDSDSLSKSISDSISQSQSESQSLSEAEQNCNFIMQGVPWVLDGALLNVAQVTNDGPDTVLVTGIRVLPSGIVDAVEPSFPPFSILMGEFVTITVDPLGVELVGIQIETPCGNFLYPYGQTGAFTGPLIPI